MGQLSLKFILSRVVQFLCNEIENSEVVADGMVECSSGDSCTIIGCRTITTAHHPIAGGGATTVEAINLNLDARANVAETVVQAPQIDCWSRSEWVALAPKRGPAAGRKSKNVISVAATLELCHPQSVGLPGQTVPTCVRTSGAHWISPKLLHP